MKFFNMIGAIHGMMFYVHRTNGRYYQHGISSFGDFECGRKADGFAEVQILANWIAATVLELQES